MNMTVRKPKTAVETALIEQFSAHAGALPGTGDLTMLRDRAIDRIAQSGLPTRRQERWHYTDLRALLQAMPQPGDVPETGAALLNGAIRLGLEDGGAELPGGLPNGVTVSRMADRLLSGSGLPTDLGQDDAIGQINTGFAADGYVIGIGADIAPGTVIEIDDRSGSGGHVRHAVNVAAGASVVIVERQRGHGFNSSIATLSVGERAEVDWVRVQERDASAVDLGRLETRVAASGQFRLVIVNGGGKLVRQEVDVEIAGEGADFKLRAINMIADDQHVDITMTVNHAVPETTSTELVRNVVTGRGQGVFQGQIKVASVAQKTDARMACNTLLLSDDAGFSAKPELEIFADDVACGHGATVAEIDADHLFYLMARGIPEKAARALLIKAFVAELVEEIDNETIVEALEARLDAWFEAHA